MLAITDRYTIILGSQSPRRRELLAGLGIAFEVRPMPGVDESYPASLDKEEIPVYIAANKAKAYSSVLQPNELLITADTLVWIDGRILGKPTDRADAAAMLRLLAGNTHHVITGVCLTTREKTVTFSVTSTVRMASLSKEDIDYYIDTFRPYDKAGAYGIQEWIGYVAVEAINGSFYNVMGLPIQRVYQELMKF
ncbi:MAG: Maf-like protein [Tannerellaceae bacterium]|jgi:septum formation protein|nr:Maf-like protein [Tannerellaceae bacterium]